ncbi:MAG: hypothetical protein EBR30_15020 [Cytophagia bacterium]|nr:hypothetical protein [Cytophagia bacterium]
MKILMLTLLFSLNDNPPGTVRVKNYFVDKTEIQNIHWLEYVYHMQQELGSAGIQKLLPDSSNFWYSNPEHRFQPVVLITYEQALAYCEWRSKVVSERIGRKIRYRLPTKTEWSDIAEAILKTDLKEIEQEMEDTKRVMSKNDSAKYILFQKDKPKSRVYHLFNNVTEMTLEKGIAMGPNNYELLNPDASLTKLIMYNAPGVYLGFRCVAEIE